MNFLVQKKAGFLGEKSSVSDTEFDGGNFFIFDVSNGEILVPFGS